MPRINEMAVIAPFDAASNTEVSVLKMTKEFAIPIKYFSKFSNDNKKNSYDFSIAIFSAVVLLFSVSG